MSTQRTAKVQAGPAGETEINDLAARAQKEGPHGWSIGELLTKLTPLCIGGAASRFKSIEREDRRQIGWMAINDCLKTWDPDRGSFVSLAKIVVYHALVDELERGADRGSARDPETGRKPKADATAHATGSPSEAATAAFRAVTPDFQNDVAAQLDLEAASKQLSKRDRFAFECRNLGFTAREIADQLGCTAAQARNVQETADRRIGKILSA